MKSPTRIVALAAFSIGVLALTSCTGGGASSGASGPIDTSGELSGKIQFQTWSLKNEKFTPYF